MRIAAKNVMWAPSRNGSTEIFDIEVIKVSVFSFVFARENVSVFTSLNIKLFD